MFTEPDLELNPMVPLIVLAFRTESLTVMVTESVGGSIGVAAMGISTAGSAIVSATVDWVSPAMATMSPASASSTGTRVSPRKASTLVMRPRSTSVPSRWMALTWALGAMRPLSMRPVRIRPR